MGLVHFIRLEPKKKTPHKIFYVIYFRFRGTKLIINLPTDVSSWGTIEIEKKVYRWDEMEPRYW